MKKSDFIFLTAVSLLFYFLMRWDSASWYYSAIGDEYAFFNFAKEIALGKSVNPLNQDGVYGIIPTLSSIYQAGIMKVWGINNAGWKTSEILIVIFSFFPYYFLVKNLINDGVAKISLIIFASSHYLWAYIHTGYPNIEAIFPTIFSIYFLWKGLKNKNWPWLFLSGIFAGLGFYTFYSSRVTILIIFSLALINAIKTKFSFAKTAIKTLFPMACGFLLLFLPFLLVNKEAVFTKMLNESLASSTEARTTTRTTLLLQNIPRSFSAFFSNSHIGPYVSGSLLDPISGMLFLGGLAIALINFRRLHFNLILIWYLWAFLTTGVFSEFSYVSVSRLNFLLPPASIFAGLVFYKLKEIATERQFLFVSLGVLTIIFALNINRFYLETPKIFQLTPEATAIGAFLDECSQKKTVIIDNYYEPLLKPVIDSYQFPKPPTLISNNDFAPIMLEKFDCFVFARKNDEEIQSTIRTFDKDQFITTNFTDFSKLTSIIVIKKYK